MRPVSSCLSLCAATLAAFAWMAEPAEALGAGVRAGGGARIGGFRGVGAAPRYNLGAGILGGRLPRARGRCGGGSCLGGFAGYGFAGGYGYGYGTVAYGVDLGGPVTAPNPGYVAVPGIREAPVLPPAIYVIGESRGTAAGSRPDRTGRRASAEPVADRGPKIVRMPGARYR